MPSTEAAVTTKSALCPVEEAHASFTQSVAAVKQRSQSVTMLRNGEPAARLVPALPADSPYGILGGSITEIGDIIAPTGEDFGFAGK